MKIVVCKRIHSSPKALEQGYALFNCRLQNLNILGGFLKQGLILFLLLTEVPLSWQYEQNAQHGASAEGEGVPIHFHQRIDGIGQPLVLLGKTGHVVMLSLKLDYR